MELVLTGIRKDFGEKKVLRDVSCTFEKGKIYGLLGRNGAGKTTLFNCLAGELDPDGGTARLTEDGLSRPLDVEDVGYVFSTPILPEFLTGYEFVRFLMDIHLPRHEKQAADAQLFHHPPADHPAGRTADLL